MADTVMAVDQFIRPLIDSYGLYSHGLRPVHQTFDGLPWLSSQCTDRAALKTLHDPRR